MADYTYLSTQPNNFFLHVLKTVNNTTIINCDFHTTSQQVVKITDKRWEQETKLADHDGNVMPVVKRQRAVLMHEIVVCSLKALQILGMVRHHLHYVLDWDRQMWWYWRLACKTTVVWLISVSVQLRIHRMAMTAVWQVSLHQNGHIDRMRKGLHTFRRFVTFCKIVPNINSLTYLLTYLFTIIIISVSQFQIQKKIMITIIYLL